MNRWNIPVAVEREVLERDRSCVYCGIAFGRPDAPRPERQSWEHIINDLSIVTLANIALCCIGCNASKGARPLSTWLQLKYCRAKCVTAESVAPVVRDVLARASGGDGVR